MLHNRAERRLIAQGKGRIQSRPNWIDYEAALWLFYFSAKDYYIMTSEELYRAVDLIQPGRIACREIFNTEDYDYDRDVMFEDQYGYV